MSPSSRRHHESFVVVVVVVIFQCGLWFHVTSLINEAAVGSLDPHLYFRVEGSGSNNQTINAPPHLTGPREPIVLQQKKN